MARNPYRPTVILVTQVITLTPWRDVPHHALDCLGNVSRSFLVYGVAGISEHNMFPAGNTGDEGLVVTGPDPALLLWPACGRADHDDGHIGQGAFGPKAPDLRQGHEGQLMLVADHPDLGMRGVTPHVGIENQALELLVVC